MSDLKSLRREIIKRRLHSGPFIDGDQLVLPYRRSSIAISLQAFGYQLLLDRGPLLFEERFNNADDLMTYLEER